MSGGTQGAEARSVETGGVPDGAALSLVGERWSEDEGATLPDWRVRIAAVVAVASALGWLGLIAATTPGLIRWAMPLVQIPVLIASATPPLALIALLYLISVRTSRSEGARLARVSHGLRAEQARLAAVLTQVTTQVAAERDDIAEQADRLMTIGEDAATRLRAIGGTLRRDFDGLSQQADAIRQAGAAARADIDALLAALPDAHAATHRNGAGARCHGYCRTAARRRTRHSDRRAHGSRARGRWRCRVCHSETVGASGAGRGRCGDCRNADGHGVRNDVGRDRRRIVARGGSG